MQVENVKKKTKNVKERTHNDMMLYVSVLEPLNRIHRDTEDEEKPYFSKRPSMLKNVFVKSGKSTQRKTTKREARIGTMVRVFQNKVDVGMFRRVVK